MRAVSSGPASNVVVRFSGIPRTAALVFAGGDKLLFAYGGWLFVEDYAGTWRRRIGPTGRIDG